MSIKHAALCLWMIVCLCVITWFISACFVLYSWTALTLDCFHKLSTLSLSHLFPGFAAAFSLTSRSVSTFKRVFIRVYSAKIEILQKIAHQITWLQNKRSEIWLSLCRRMGWIGYMFRRKEFISNCCKSMLLCTGKKGEK